MEIGMLEIPMTFILGWVAWRLAVVEKEVKNIKAVVEILNGERVDRLYAEIQKEKAEAEVLPL